MWACPAGALHIDLSPVLGAVLSLATVRLPPIPALLPTLPTTTRNWAIRISISLVVAGVNLLLKHLLLGLVQLEKRWTHTSRERSYALLSYVAMLVGRPEGGGVGSQTPSSLTG